MTLLAVGKILGILVLIVIVALRTLRTSPKDQAARSLIKEEQANAAVDWILRLSAEKEFASRTIDLKYRLSQAIKAELIACQGDYTLSRGGFHRSFDSLLETAPITRMDIMGLQSSLPKDFSIHFSETEVRATIGGGDHTVICSNQD